MCPPFFNVCVRNYYTLYELNIVALLECVKGIAIAENCILKKDHP